MTETVWTFAGNLTHYTHIAVEALIVPRRPTLDEHMAGINPPWRTIRAVFYDPKTDRTSLHIGPRMEAVA